MPVKLLPVWPRVRRVRVPVPLLAGAPAVAASLLKVFIRRRKVMPRGSPNVRAAGRVASIISVVTIFIAPVPGQHLVLVHFRALAAAAGPHDFTVYLVVPVGIIKLVVAAGAARFMRWHVNDRLSAA